MKRKKIYTLILATTILSTSFVTPTFASTSNKKEEVVYGILNDNGDAKDLFIVNNIDAKDGKIIDYGNYSSIRNLNTEDSLTINNGEITSNTSSEKLYYEGVLSSFQLPWDINFEYKLDGKKIDSKDLAGKDGDLEITISTKENKSANEVFYKNYALSISTSLDTNICSDIKAPGGTIASVGEKKSISYTNLPNKEATYKITTKVKDFEMDPISINAIPFSMNLNLSSLDNISQSLLPLQDGISQVNNGAKTLEEGANELYVAMNTLNKNSDTLQSSSTEIMNAIKVINDSLASIKELTSPNGPISTLKTASENYLVGINDLASKSQLLVASSNEIYNYLKTTNNALTTITTDTEETKKLIQALASMNNEYVNKLIALYNGKMAAISNVNNGLSQIVPKYEEFNNGIASLSQGAENLSKSYGELNNAINTLSSKITELDKLIKGMDTLNTQYQSFNNGVSSYTNAYKSITEGFNNLVSGITSISDATNEIDSKTSTLDKDIEEKLDTALSEYKNDDFKPVSFVSDKNTEVTAVQFVMKTNEIKKDIVENKVEEKPTKLTFIEKLKNIFK